MKLRSLEKVKKIEYPTISKAHNNSFMKKVPLFSAALSSMLFTNTVCASETVGLAGDIMITAGVIQAPSPIKTITACIFLTTAIISLITIFINAFKSAKLTKAYNAGRENEDNELEENDKIDDTDEKLKKLKKQTYLALAIFILSLAVISFITNFY